METKAKTITCESVEAIYIYIGYSFIKHGICGLTKNTNKMIKKDSDKSQNKNGSEYHCLFGV